MVPAYKETNYREDTMLKPSPAQIAYHIGSALKHKAVVMGLLLDVCKVLIKRGIIHDLSKLSAIEIRHYAPIVPLLSKLKYGTPEYLKAVEDMGSGVQHHYENNDHHPEHWKGGIDDMSPIVLIEMLADWKAANLRRGGTPEDFQKSIAASANRFKFSIELAKSLTRMAHELGW
jgi:hypothetical protein